MAAPLPGHLARDVRFDHAAAATAADELRRLARALEGHATDRAQWLVSTAGFRGRGRRTVGELTRRHEQRIAALSQSLHAEAGRIEAAAAAARRDQARLERDRAAWWRQQRLVG